VSVIVVVEDVQMAGVEEVAVLWIADVNHSAFLTFSIGVDQVNAFIAVVSIHPANSVESNKAATLALGPAVPVATFICVIFEPCSKSIGNLRSCLRMAGDSVISNVGSRNLKIFLDSKAGPQNQQGADQQDMFHL
jgi:hypothetical protein